MFFKQMKRLLAAATACVLLAVWISALAVSYPCAGTVRTAVTLRRSAGDSTALASLPAGDAVYVTGESGSYYIVEYEGVTGFVAKSAVTLTGGDGANLPSAEYAARYAALRQGDEGQAVSDLQSALIELGFLSGKADGKYGKKTAEAVAAFQLKNSLVDSGCADAATLGLLFEGKPLNSKGKAKTVSVAPDIEGFPVSSGKKGVLVGRIQAALKALEYYGGTVDGKYGSGTESAVKKFQTKNGLKSTGVADAETQRLLFGGGAMSAKQTPTPVPTKTPVPPVIGWENGVPVGETASYPFDTVTTDAVNMRKGASTGSARILTVPKGAAVTVQSMKGSFLYVKYNNGKKTYTGYVMTRYVDVPAVYLGGRELQESATARAKYTGMSQGAAGERVSALQTALKELGFYTGSISGSYDAATVLAVKDMQAKNGILQTGIASPELQELIFEGKPLNSKGKKTDVAVLPPVAGVSMRSGDTGYQVAELQEQLRELGYYTAAVNGVYDKNTVEAVKAFQKNKGLTADGAAGARVLSALSAALATPTPVVVRVTATPAPVTAENVIVVHRGTRGLIVSRLQARLAELGYYAVTPDGIYNADDIAAVRAFQKQNGLTADGVAGLETQQLLFDGDPRPAWATPTPKPTATPRPTATPKPDTGVTLKIGARGDSVNLLQARLTVLNYFSDVIDGRFGTQTAQAVSAFQQNNGLTADGIAGPKTLQKLYSANAKAASAPAATAEPVLNTAKTLRIGDRGDAVRALQQQLISLGYLSGSADGIFGVNTNLAVKAFQKDNGLTRDGVAGPATLGRLQDAADRAKAAAQTQTKPANAVTGTDFKAPQAAEVRFCDWYSESRAQAKLMPDAVIYDYATGLHYNVHMFSFGKHADAEPVTASDTAIMQQIMGVQNWEPHAVWVILTDGKVYMASTHSHGHEIDHNAYNGLDGHICIHFPREMSEDELLSMPYALRHQNEILRGWEETQARIYQ